MGVRPLRRQDLRASRRPDIYIANSTEVADRIKRFYGREAVVVPPPVAVEDFPRDVPRDPGCFLWVHRLVSYKRPLEVAEARALYARKSLPVRRAVGGGVEFLVPRVEIHEVISLELA